jgi:myo-inositol-1(or 4)-monophosphatase
VSASEEQALLAVALQAAEAGAAELRARFGGRAAGVRAKSTDTDLVSDADLAAEAAIREVLRRARPADAVLGEEGGESAAVAGALRWVVDPLDGTINFLFGVPQFAVSVACEDADGETLAGVVLDPLRDERFIATRTGPALLGELPIRGSERTELARALVATGFGYDARMRARQAEVLGRVLPATRDIRRGGAAALDLAWCACGRFDAYFERGVKAWDIAAGALIARRAGLEVRRIAARGEEEPEGIATAPARLIGPLLALVEG